MIGLNNGELFPKMELRLVGGGQLMVPADLSRSYAVLLAYRGSWCTFCNAHLASFEQAMPRLREENITVLAFSVDDEAHAKETVDKHNLSFPVGYGVDLEQTGALLKCYINRQRGVLEASNFLLAPDGRVEVAVYSSKTIGRFVPDDVIAYVRRLRTH